MARASCLPTRIVGVQRGHGVLEDEAERVATQHTQLLVAASEDRVPENTEVAGHAMGVLGQQPAHREAPACSCPTRFRRPRPAFRRHPVGGSRRPARSPFLAACRRPRPDREYRESRSSQRAAAQRVQEVAQPVAQEIDRQDRCRQQQAGRKDQPGSDREVDAAQAE